MKLQCTSFLPHKIRAKAVYAFNHAFGMNPKTLVGKRVEIQYRKYFIRGVVNRVELITYGMKHGGHFALQITPDE